jgi:hypothetical protein
MPKPKKRGFIILVTVIVAILLIGVSYYVYVQYISKEPVVPPVPKPPQQDDRISPLVQQGLILEIDRIRDRGLLDKIMKTGTSWKQKPQFYFISNIDGSEYISKDVASAGGVKTETLFNTWDTIFQENKIMKSTENEQEKSDVSLTIMERQKTGLLGRHYQDVQQEKITVTYDYRTGHWTGDDYLNDSDGYGHYLGKTFEVWFNIYQTDYNHDYIPYYTEVNTYQLSPNVSHIDYDPNHDGIPIPWDWKYGYDPFAYDNHSMADPDHDGLTNLQEYKMQKYFADPFHQDIYIESDGMQRGGLLDPPHVFWEESQQIVIERFSEHNINVYIDNGWPGDPTNGGGESLPHIKTLSQDSGMMLQFYKNHFSDDRKGIFRYLVIGHNAGFCHPSEFNMYDTLAVDTSNYKFFFKRQAYTPRTQRLVLAAATMHELGHSLGIAPWTWGGNDNLTFAQGKQQKQDFLAAWGNYKSVMNYYYIWNKQLVDYSDGSHGPRDQNDWKAFDLTFFKQDDHVIEDPGFKSPPSPPVTS